MHFVNQNYRTGDLAPLEFQLDGDLSERGGVAQLLDRSCPQPIDGSIRSLFRL